MGWQIADNVQYIYIKCSASEVQLFNYSYHKKLETHGCIFRINATDATGAKAPGHPNPQCWQKIHNIEQALYKILHGAMLEN